MEDDHLDANLYNNSSPSSFGRLLSQVEQKLRSEMKDLKSQLINAGIHPGEEIFIHISPTESKAGMIDFKDGKDLKKGDADQVGENGNGDNWEAGGKANQTDKTDKRDEEDTDEGKPIGVGEDLSEEGPDKVEDAVLAGPTKDGYHFVVIHRVVDPQTIRFADKDFLYYLDEPRAFKDERNYFGQVPFFRQYIKGLQQIPNLDKYLESQPEIAFVIFKDYDIQVPHDGPPATPIAEEISFSSLHLQNAIGTVRNALQVSKYSEWWSASTMQEPYLPWYHYRTQISDHVHKLQGDERSCLELLVEYMQANHGASFEEADALLSRGLVSRKHLSKLFRPEDILLKCSGDHPLGYICEDVPHFGGMSDLKTTVEAPSSISIRGASLSFDGLFHLETTELALHFPPGTEVATIFDLDVYPLRYDTTGVRARLENRGRNFWMCRRRSYVCYKPPDPDARWQTGKPRFMIDYSTYRKLHPDAVALKNTSDKPGPPITDDEQPPTRFLTVFPATIEAFAMEDKTWRNLIVEHIEPIQWNTKAFERLVLKKEAKELVQALVTVHISNQKSTDIIEGKGNGLIILLHGSPGTGKTLTAESVAELAQKPLYRVTSGDIGTDAEAVEANLESVLYIGRIWGCVVLIDEADIFLESRSLMDLQRNVLVSVFLRVLEYHEGILILTSNRVGVFDEAFKSRIQLALHYKPLEKADRRKVWRNFFKTLENTKGEADFDDLDDHLDDLADFEMNGRQIRNALSTATELAKFRKEELNFEHLKHVIKIAREFDDYLTRTHGHSDDEWAREERVRA